MARTEPDLRDMHLDHLIVVVGATILMEPAARRTFDGRAQRIGDLLHCVFMAVIKFEEDGTLAGLQLVIELLHHLP